MKIALIGAGQRGRVYADYMLEKNYAEFAAVVEPDAQRRADAAQHLGVAPEYCFDSAEPFWALGRVADAVIVASMDRDHYAQVMAALDLGYDILLEKPISPSPAECLAIEEKAKQKGCRVVVCHVLRYTNFFATIKEILDSGSLGRIISIQHNENVGNFHMAHSFVRGNWRRADLSSPMIMQKSCHDMDILTWLTDSQPARIASFGSLQYFKEANAPAGSSDRCCTCAVEATCRFSAYKAYLPAMGFWPANLLGPDQTEPALRKALETSPYGRCVYRCDNDVCDTQVTLIEFENGATVSFNLSAFTNRMCRTLKIMCEHGEIRGTDGEGGLIEVVPFASNQSDGYEIRKIRTAAPRAGHGGGDIGIVDDFIELLRTHGGESRSSIQQSVISHLMAAAAEESRLSGRVVDMHAFRADLQ